MFISMRNPGYRNKKKKKLTDTLGGIEPITLTFKERTATITVTYTIGNTQPKFSNRPANISRINKIALEYRIS